MPHDPIWHAQPAADVAKHLETDPRTGLSLAEVARRQSEYGPNQLKRQTGPGALLAFLLQFHQPLVYILLAAAVVTGLLDEYIDAAVIFGVVLVNAIVGFIQESRAAKAIDALAKTLVVPATVRRDGRVQRISAVELVPGDIVLVASGDQVPADLRLVQARDLRVAEAALTGESLPIEKQVDPLPEDTPLADRKNLAFASALATYGQAVGIVIAIGSKTEVGKIQELIHSAEDLSTPLTRDIAKFSRWLMVVILGVAGFTVAVGTIQGQELVNLFHAAVALAVAAIPEGLPAAVTVVLATGVWRMAARHAIIRKLPAVEALGSTSVICSDKTGTLTENQMTVQKVWTGTRWFGITGSGYDPTGDIRCEDDSGDNRPRELLECLKAGMLCNDSRIVQKDGRWEIEGDPTEAALLAAGRKAGLNEAELERQMPRLDVIPFASENQYMATLHDRGPGKSRIAFVKGSVEVLASRSPDVDRGQVQAAAEEMGKQGLRVLAFACKEIPVEENQLTTGHIEDKLNFLGLQGMIDPPRSEAIKAVAACRGAKVEVKMITGDHATTASAIATQLGMGAGKSGIAPPVLTGRELEKLSDSELADKAEEVCVFARVTPEQKLRLVKALQSRGRVAAMTGDGVNDAPALKQADIGVAMGITGTEVAKDAADMVLTDDNFASIVAAVEEGRGVFDNLSKFIVWTLPTNLGEGLVILVAVLCGIVLPILPVQILWINMTTAVFLGMMLTFEPKEPDLMRRPPRDPRQSFLTLDLIRRMVLVGLAMLAGAFGLFNYELHQGGHETTEHAEAVARTVATTVFVMVEAFYLFNCRHLRRTFLGGDYFDNPWAYAGFGAMITAQLLFVYAPFMNLAFHSAPMSLGAWGRVLAIAITVFFVVEAETWWVNRRRLKVTGQAHDRKGD